MADMKRIKGRIAETIYPNGQGAITAESHQALLLEMVDDINTKKADQSELVATQESLEALTDTVNNLPQGGGDVKADGVYPDLTAGDLAGRGESVPAEFGFRASGGKSIKDGRAYIKRIKGNSVVWNQLLPNSTTQVTSNATRALNEGTRIVVGHKYLLLADFGGGTSYAGVRLYARASGESKIIIGLANNENKTYKFFTAEMGGVSNGTGSAEEGNIWQYFYFEGTTESITNTRLIDLTQMFGAGYEPNTIEEFNARVATLGIDMYAYNEGQVIHCNTESIKSVGDNALNADRSLVFDFVGSYENYDFINTEDAFVGLSADGYINKGAIDYAEKIEGGFRFRSNGGGYGIGLFVKALPNEEYSVSYASDNGRITFGFYDKDKKFISYQLWENRFTTPSSCEYIMLCLRDNEVINVDISFTDIMLALVHSGWPLDTDAGYRPYWEYTLPLPIIRKYFPDGMMKAGSAHDEIRYNKASGKWEKVQRIGSVDLGSLTWDVASNNRMIATSLENVIVRKDAANDTLLCAKYTNAYQSEVYLNTSDRIICSTNVGHIFVYDSAYTDAATFKAAMQGVILYYELAEPIVTEITEDFRDYYNVADFGTEQSQSAVPSAAFSADIIYQFNAVDMIREHELEITELQSIIATMQAQLTSLINGGQ